MTQTALFDRPVTVFDLETTSADPKSARIVSIGLVRLEVDGTVGERVEYVVNPGVPIPPSASAIHGITDAMVADKPPFAQIVEQINDFVTGTDLAGFNMIRFDLEIIRREYNRVGAGAFLPDAKLLDAMVIFHRQERRDLTAAVSFYLNKELEGAHGALADATATAEVLVAQLARYDLPKGTDALQDYCLRKPENALDRRGKLAWVDDEAVFQFGKVRGQSLQRVVETAGDYLKWILSSDFDDDLKAIINDALEGNFPTKG